MRPGGLGPLSVKLAQDEILKYLAEHARRYLEVGVQEGLSLDIVCRAASLEHATLCDTWGTVSGGTGRGNHDHIEALLERLPRGHRPATVTYLDGDSRQRLPQIWVPMLTKDMFDLVHIDGGHSYDVAASDLKYGWDLCSDTMVVHDICMEDVWRAFYEFAQRDLVITNDVKCFYGGHGTAVVRRWR